MKKTDGIPFGIGSKPPAARLSRIATDLGVSASTVSRALRRPELVREETRETIILALREAGYAVPTKREAARARSGLLALVVPDLLNPFFTALAKAAVDEARRHGNGLIVSDTNGGLLDEGEIIRMAQRRADGMIVVSPRMTDAHVQESVGAIPTVLVNQQSAGVPSILINYRGGMRQAVEHLAAFGHRAVAYVEGPSSAWANRQRQDAFDECTKASGMEASVIGPYAPRFEGGVQAADVALARNVSAVIAYNDTMALGVMSRLIARGVEIPRQFSVIGFDDIPEAAIWSPALTTVGISQASVGEMAVRDLLRLLASGVQRADDTRTISSDLVVRASTGPLA